MKVLLAKTSGRTHMQVLQNEYNYTEADMLRNEDGTYTVMDPESENVLVDHMTDNFLNMLKLRGIILLKEDNQDV